MTSKKEIIEEVAEKTGIERKTVENVVNTSLEVIFNTLSWDEVRLEGINVAGGEPHGKFHRYGTDIRLVSIV